MMDIEILSVDRFIPGGGLPDQTSIARRFVTTLNRAERMGQEFERAYREGNIQETMAAWASHYRGED